MQFEIRALDERLQRVVSLSVDALDEADARAQLGTQPLTLLDIQRRDFKRPGRGEGFSVLLFTQELHALVQAGLSLVESLEAFAEKERASGNRAVLERLLTALREGRRFSAALRAQGEVFPPLFVGLVEAAENTGELPQALERYLGYAQRVQVVRQRVISASIYPGILLGAGALVALFLMGYVVPRFAAVYKGAGRPLPWGSQVLMDWGQFAGDHGPPLLLGLAVVAAVLVAWARGVGRRGAWSRVAALVPGVARWLELLMLSRLFLTLGLLLRGGLPVQQALGLSASVLPPDRQPRIEQVQQRIAEGWALSVALDEAGLATPISSRFLRAGERSGQLAEMLQRAAEYHDGETARWIERFSRTFEPLLMAAIGLVIGLIVLLLYMPIFELAGGLQ